MHKSRDYGKKVVSYIKRGCNNDSKIAWATKKNQKKTPENLGGFLILLLGLSGCPDYQIYYNQDNPCNDIIKKVSHNLYPFRKSAPCKIPRR